MAELMPWPSGTAPAPLYCEADRRLNVLASYNSDVLDGDEELARIARFAAQLCGAEMAAVSLVGTEFQRFIARENIPVSETPVSTSLCAHAMLGDGVLQMLDVAHDPRLADFGLSQSDSALPRSYIGAPLISAEGAPLGALCLMGHDARSAPLSDFEHEGMLVLAQAVMRRLNAHRQKTTINKELEASTQRLQFMLDSVPDIAWSAHPGGAFDHFNARFEEVTGIPSIGAMDEWRSIVHPDDFDGFYSDYETSIGSATLHESEWRLRQADGSYRWIIARAVPTSHDPAEARWFGTLTDIHDRYLISQERELLAGELAHRIKNLFAVIIGLITLRARGHDELSDFATLLSENIRALARAQEFALNQTHPSEPALQALLGVLMAPYRSGRETAVTISGNDAQTGTRAASPLAMVFHELATNSAKYGALSVAEGQVGISVSHEADHVHIEWVERAGPETQPPQGTGFGSRLVQMAVEHQLLGQISHEWHRQGLRAKISVPAEQLAR